MLRRFIILILFALLTVAAAPAQADSTQESTVPAQQKDLPPANMSDEALASYISGRLTPLLKDDGYKVSQNCDSAGCSVVVQ